MLLIEDSTQRVLNKNQALTLQLLFSVRQVLLSQFYRWGNRFREVKKRAQRHRAYKWRVWAWNLSSLAPGCIFLISEYWFCSFYHCLTFNKLPYFVNSKILLFFFPEHFDIKIRMFVTVQLHSGHGCQQECTRLSFLVVWLDQCNPEQIIQGPFHGEIWTSVVVRRLFVKIFW